MLTRELIKRIRRIEIVTNRAVNETLAGQYHSVFKGLGMEFSEVRAYQPGDDIRFIDWNVSARMRELYVKQFREERQLTVMLLVDRSASGTFGTRERLKSELAAEVSALLAFSAIKNNDRVGLVLFTDRIETYVPPKKGRKHILRIVSEILSTETRGRGTNITAALDFLQQVHRRKAVVFLISDFQEGGYARRLGAMSRRFDVVPIVIFDRIERQLPGAGLVTLRDAETGEVRVVDLSDRVLREVFQRRVFEETHAREALFKRLGLDFITLSPGEEYMGPLVRFFQRRAKRVKA